MERKHHKPDDSVAKLEQAKVLLAQGEAGAGGGAHDRCDRANIRPLMRGLRRLEIEPVEAAKAPGAAEQAPAKGEWRVLSGEAGAEGFGAPVALLKPFRGLRGLLGFRAAD
jgi:hypothetical protein